MTLDELGKMLVADTENARDLWDVMTALRGPDNEDDDIKRATTEVIRWHLLGKDPNMSHFSGSYCGQDSEADMRLRLHLTQACPEEGLHFLNHATKAFEALGLVWDKVNT